MTADLLKRKYEAECEAYGRIGLYKRYSFLFRLSNDHQLARDILLQDKFTRTQVTRTKSMFDHYQKKKNHQSIMRGNALNTLSES